MRPTPARLALLLAVLLAGCSGPRPTVVVLKDGTELAGEVRGEAGGIIDLVAPDGEELPLARVHVRAIEGAGPHADPPIAWREVPVGRGPDDRTGGDPPASWVRAVRRGEGGSLDVAAGLFERPDGLRVYLVGAVHVAHADAFAAQQSLLDSLDLVLWEGVGGTERPDPRAMERFDVLFKTQVLLKNVLNLDFQLEQVDYARPFWRNSDMALDEVQAELERRGLSILPNEELFRALFGTLFRIVDPASMPRSEAVGRPYRGLVAPLMADTERVFEHAGAEGLKEVLILARNRRVMADLAAVLAQPDAPRRIGIYYGAGHMPDMARTLQDELGFRWVGVHWVPAWRW